jgi:hypothetical protein
VVTGQQVSVTLTPEAVAGVVAYSVTPLLPAGLNLVPAVDGTSAEISGTPTLAIPATEFAVVAEDTVVDPADPTALVTTTATATVAIRVDGHLSVTGSPATGAVSPPVAPALSLASPDLVGSLSFLTEPALPAGLSFASDGALVGSPTTPTPLTTYTVTATNGAGARATTSFALRVGGAALASTTTSIIGQLGVPVSGVSFGDPTWTGVTYDIAPTRPAGLAIDGAGALTWTPSEPLTSTEFTVTAMDSTSSAIASATLRMRVSTVTPAAQVIDASVGETITTTQALVAAGLGAGVTFSATPPLGLTMNPTTGRVTGRPIVLWPTSDVVVTATDVAGATATAAITITVAPTQLQVPFLYLVRAGTTPGSLSVQFAGSPNAPTGLTYAAEISDATGTTLVKTVRPMTSLTQITGLSPGVTYSVVIVADPLTGYLGARSLARTGEAASAGGRLPAPVIVSIVGGPAQGSIVVTFTPSSGAPSGQTYAAQVYREDQSTLVASVTGQASPITVTGLTPGTRYYVVVVAHATTGFLESLSRGRVALASGALATPGVATTSVPALATSGRPDTTARLGVHVGAGWYVLPSTSASSALRVRVKRPTASVAKAPTVRIPVNRAVALRVVRSRSTRPMGVDLRAAREWIALGAPLSLTARTITLPIIRASVPGRYFLRLRQSSGRVAYLKVVVTRL